MEYIRGFDWESTSWHREVLPPKPFRTDAIIIGYFLPDGRLGGSYPGGLIEIIWGTPFTNVELRIPDDCWKMLFSEMKDVVEYFISVNDTNIQPQEVVSKLLELGFKDVTEKESPDLPFEHTVFVPPSEFEAIYQGVCTSYVCINDKKYKTGDTLVVREFVQKEDLTTGQFITCRVTHVVTGLPNNLCVLSIIPKLPR